MNCSLYIAFQRVRILLKYVESRICSVSGLYKEVWQNESQISVSRLHSLPLLLGTALAHGSSQRWQQTSALLQPSDVLFPCWFKHRCFGPFYLMNLKIPALFPALFLTTPGCCSVLSALLSLSCCSVGIPHPSLGLGEPGLWARPAWLLLQPKLPGLKPLCRKRCRDNLQFPFPGRRWNMTGTFLAWPQGHSWSWTLPAQSVTWQVKSSLTKEFFPVALALWVKSIQYKQETFKYWSVLRSQFRRCCFLLVIWVYSKKLH